MYIYMRVQANISSRQKTTFFDRVVCGQSGEVLKKAKEHSRQINDIQTSVDLTMVITASKDNTAKVKPLYTFITMLLVKVESNCYYCCLKSHTVNRLHVLGLVELDS